MSRLDEEQQQQLLLIERMNAFNIKGRDKHGRKILHIIGKFFPSRLVSADALKKYLEERIFPKLGKRPFALLYVHTDVEKNVNFPGISALRSIYESIPINVKENLETVYFIHPDLQSRLFLATFGRVFFSGGLYSKVKYVSRMDYLWQHLRRHEVEIPTFVYDHDEDLDFRPMMDYGLESDHPRARVSPVVDSTVPMYSMRCIS